MSKESSLHKTLKHRYVSLGNARQEVLIDGYYIDIAYENSLIEIQTRGFYSLRPKLYSLVDKYPIRVVFPIALEKWIVHLPLRGEIPLNRRKSPRRGRPEHIFNELIRFPSLINHPNLSFEILMIKEEEIRRNDGKGSWRRKGWSIIDHRLLTIEQSYVFNSPSDFHIFIPESLLPEFTTKDLAHALEIPARLAQKAAYCMRSMGVIESDRKKGRYQLYQKSGRFYESTINEQ